MTRTLAVRTGIVVVGVAAAATMIGLTLMDSQSYGWGVVFVAYAVMGSLVLWRQQDNRIGWLLLGIGVAFATIMGLTWITDSRWGPGPALIEMTVALLSGVAWITFLMMVALFPEGYSTTLHQRWLVRIGLLLLVATSVVTLTSRAPMPLTQRTSPFAVDRLARVDQVLEGPGQAAIALLSLCVLISLFVRWRRSVGTLRQQFKWFLFGAAVTIVTFTIGSTTSAGPSIVGYALWTIGGSALPIAIGVAVSRYRLYDIDRVISRTTSYAIVTGLLVATFAVIVAVSSSVLGPKNQLGVAVATLVAAALARPVLRRVQGVVDQRFDRARYDGQRTVDEFGNQLSQEVDVATVRGTLLHTVHASLAPNQLSLWIREPA